MTKESLDSLKKAIKTTRLVSLSLYLVGSILTLTLTLIGANTLAGTITLILAILSHVLSEIINKEYKDKFFDEINRNKKKIRI